MTLSLDTTRHGGFFILVVMLKCINVCLIFLNAFMTTYDAQKLNKDGKSIGKRKRFFKLRQI